MGDIEAININTEWGSNINLKYKNETERKQVEEVEIEYRKLYIRSTRQDQW